MVAAGRERRKRSSSTACVSRAPVHLADCIDHYANHIDLPPLYRRHQRSCASSCLVAEAVVTVRAMTSIINACTVCTHRQRSIVYMDLVYLQAYVPTVFCWRSPRQIIVLDSRVRKSESLKVIERPCAQFMDRSVAYYCNVHAANPCSFEKIKAKV